MTSCQSRFFFGRWVPQRVSQEGCSKGQGACKRERFFAFQQLTGGFVIWAFDVVFPRKKGVIQPLSPLLSLRPIPKEGLPSAALFIAGQAIGWGRATKIHQAGTYADVPQIAPLQKRTIILISLETGAIKSSELKDQPEPKMPLACCWSQMLREWLREPDLSCVRLRDFRWPWAFCSYLLSWV